MKKLKTIYHQSYCGDRGECDIFYDEKFNPIWWWCNNDATYRNEYMNGLFKLLGYDIKKLPTDKEKVGDEYLKKQLGF